MVRHAVNGPGPRERVQFSCFAIQLDRVNKLQMKTNFMQKVMTRFFQSQQREFGLVVSKKTCIE